MLGLAPFWNETGQVAALVIAIVGAVYAVARVIRSSWRFVKNVDETLTVTKETHHLVKHHLGPNGDTPPLHKRVASIEHRMVKLEIAHNIKDDGVDERP